MSSHKEWLEEVTFQINKHKSNFTENEIKKYKLDRLLELSEKVAENSEYCVDCISFQPEILGIVDDVGYFTKRMTEAKVPAEVKRNYFKVIDKIYQHLERKHSVRIPGSSPKKKNQYIGAGIAIGVVIGIVIDNIGLGIAIGIALGAIAKKYKKVDE
ncbi:MAG TPA: glycine zipper family protein [Candidatus Cloacimonetes bacterium]|nr:glycine zipper family protein [Candidatus Cloacimonadota bacterium]